MEALLTKKPYEVSFSGNPVPFVLVVTPYREIEKTQDVKVNIAVQIENLFYSTFFIKVFSQQIYPDASGVIQLDIKTILDSYTEYFTPHPGTAKPMRANHQKRYKITWQLQVGEDLIGPLNTSDIFYVIKGGLPYQEWNPVHFFGQNILSLKQPLHFAPIYEKVSLNQTIYYYWIYPYADDALQTVHFTFYLDDNSTITYNLPDTIRIGKWGVCCAPAGFEQLGQPALIPANKFIIKYSIHVSAGATLVTNLFTYVVDHRKFYQQYFLLFRNSLGALDSLRLRGQVDVDADYEYQQASRSVPPSYYSNLNLLPEQVQENTEEKQQFTGNTGFVSKEATDQLRDLFLSSQLLESRNSRFYPVILLTKNTKFFSNKNFTYSLQFQWQHAWVNEYYAPDAHVPW